jgi:hypothetical protein
MNRCEVGYQRDSDCPGMAAIINVGIKYRVGNLLVSLLCVIVDNRDFSES